MKKTAFCICAALSGIFLLSNPEKATAAQVYYMGNTASSQGSGAQNGHFTYQQRVNDLVDFGAYGEYGPERSGRVSGSVAQEVDWQSLSGNKAKSFYKQGVFSTTELNLNVEERLWDDYNFESQVFLRKSDASWIEPRKDIRLKQLSMNISNDRNSLRFGDFYGDLSQFVLGASLEGFQARGRYADNQVYTGIVARTHQADEAAGSLQRNVYAGRAEYTFDTMDIPLFKLGIQGALTQDDPRSIDDIMSPVAVSNGVFGIDGEIKPVNAFNLAYELAGSIYNANEKDNYENDVEGLAFRLQPSLKIAKMNLRYMYYYVTPKFYSVVGSAMSDKEQHQLSADWTATDWFYVDFTENYYWDHLSGSSRSKRTFSDEKYLNFTVRPVASRNTLSVRPYVNYLKNTSDDPGNTGANQTTTFGISMNDSADQGRINYSLGYEFREFYDKANDKSGSDIYNRINGGLSLETKLFGRRLYISDNITVDFRAPKSTEKADITVSNTISGIYDFYDRWRLQGGFNLQEFDGSNPGTDLTSTRDFVELSYTFDKLRYTKLSLRYERNMYRPEDGGQEYTEDRGILRFTSNF